jgi:hypothetical protein
MPTEPRVPAKKRRFLATDYDFIAEHITKEIERREKLTNRSNHEKLWKEVDRQVHMEPLEKLDVSGRADPDRSWESALELGDLATASEILTADTKRLIFPSDRDWLAAHVDIEVDRIQNRAAAASEEPVSKDEIAQTQKFANAELKALMTQQHQDFGLKDRVELSIKEANHHGSFVVEVRWDETQQYSMGGVFESQAAPVWVPHSMWNCYPEPGELGLNVIYEGSMIIKSEKDLDWIKRQTVFINTKRLDNETTDKKNPIELITYFGDITVRRKTENIFLPNMKIVVARKSKIVIFAQPADHVTIIYGGHDRVDVRDPYHMSPIIKQSPNHKIATIIANKFLDNIDLKLDPTIIYDGNDPKLIAMGGPKIAPGRQYPTKGGLQNFEQIDVGDPSWAIQAITYFDQKQQQGTGVSASRTGVSRQADRVTAAQIEEEAAGSELRVVDFSEKMEKALKAFAYIQHELNKKKLNKYKFYNPEPGMPDFVVISKENLPKDAHFAIVGSKGLLNERRRSRATSEVTAFLLGNPKTENIPNLIENARQMYADAGNKNPELLMNIPEDGNAVDLAIQEVREELEAVIAQLQQQITELGQKLFQKEMELVNANDQLKLRNERAEGTESALRDQIRILKANQNLQSQFLENIGKIQDEKEALEKEKANLEHMEELAQARKAGFESGSTTDIVGPPEPAAPANNVVEFHKHRHLPFPVDIERDENGDMTRLVPDIPDTVIVEMDDVPELVE